MGNIKKYIKKKYGDHNKLIPVGEPPEDRIKKVDNKKYHKLRDKLVSNIVWNNYLAKSKEKDGRQKLDKYGLPTNDQRR